MKLTTTRGQGEYDSPHYMGVYLLPMSYLAAWAKDQHVPEGLLMLADGNGTFSKSLGLEMDGTAFGLGMRGKRFAIIAKDGVATHVNVENAGEFKVSAAEYVLGQV